MEQNGREKKVYLYRWPKINSSIERFNQKEINTKFLFVFFFRSSCVCCTRWPTGSAAQLNSFSVFFFLKLCFNGWHFFSHVHLPKNLDSDAGFDCERHTTHNIHNLDKTIVYFVFPRSILLHLIFVGIFCAVCFILDEYCDWQPIHSRPKVELLYAVEGKHVLIVPIKSHIYITLVDVVIAEMYTLVMENEEFDILVNRIEIKFSAYIWYDCICAETLLAWSQHAQSMCVGTTRSPRISYFWYSITMCVECSLHGYIYIYVNLSLYKQTDAREI